MRWVCFLFFTAALLGVLAAPVAAATALSITAIPQQVHIGDVVTLNGTITGITTIAVYLFVTGPDLDERGVTLDNLNIPAGRGLFTTAPVNMNDGSSITGNIAPFEGGGIYNTASSGIATINMNAGSSIGGSQPGEGNTAYYGGGIYNNNYLGTATVNMYIGSFITGNTATPPNTYAQGICNKNGAVIFKDSANNIIATWPAIDSFPLYDVIYNPYGDPYGFFHGGKAGTYTKPGNLRIDISESPV